MTRDRDSHRANCAFVPSIVTYPNFFGWPNASSLPKPSRFWTVPKVESRRLRSSGVIAGVRPDTCSRLVMMESASIADERGKLGEVVAAFGQKPLKVTCTNIPLYCHAESNQAQSTNGISSISLVKFTACSPLSWKSMNN